MKGLNRLNVMFFFSNIHTSEKCKIFVSEPYLTYSKIGRDTQKLNKN